MITEKQFALMNSGFWHGLLPMLEKHVRTMNRRARRFAVPLPSRAAAAAHGPINELAFRLFMASRQAGLPLSRLPADAVKASVDTAMNHVRNMRQASRAPARELAADQMDEAMALARRHLQYFRGAVVALAPSFPGCGIIAECAGDVLVSKTLYEIKAGDRWFRSVDVRQALSYCALNFAAKLYDIDTLCFLNPRIGVSVNEDLEQLCDAAAGSSAVEVLSAIVDYCCEYHRDDGLN